MNLRLKLLVLLIPAVLLAEVRLIKSDSLSVAIDYEPGKSFFVQGEGGKLQISFEDADPTAGFGEFDLPAKVIRVGIPQTGDVKLRFRTYPGGVLEDVEPAVIKYIPFGERSTSGDAFRAQEGPFPITPVEMGDIQVLRLVRFVTLKFWPVQYHPQTRRLVWFSRIEAELSFAQGARLNPQPDPLDGLIETMFINGTQAKHYKISPPISKGDPYKRAPFWLKIVVDTTGIYRITGKELLLAGVHLGGIDPKKIALWTIGEHEPNVNYPDSLRSVPVLVKDGNDGRFDPNDTLIFYGLGPDHWTKRCSVYVKNLFTNENVYWLTWGGETGKRIKQGFGPDTAGTRIIRLGKDVLHQEVDADCPARAGLLWIWTRLFKPAERSRVVFSTNLEMRYPSQLLRISGRLYHETINNEISIRFNGRKVGGFQFGQSPYPSLYDFRIDTVLPAEYRTNTLELELSGNGEKKVYLDYLEAEYFRRLSLQSGQLHFFIDDTGRCRFAVIDVPGCPVVLDVSDPYLPKACVDFEVFAESIRFCYFVSGRVEFVIAAPQQLLKPKTLELKSPGRLWNDNIQADYYIIAPTEFIAPAQELARYRNNRVPGIINARVQAVNLEDVYDDFGFGLKEPGVIKHFLSVRRPAYVLLVGDATYDYKNNLGRGKTPGVPAYESGYGLNPESGDRRTLCLDAWYADWEGEGASPDMILGRVTARTAYEFKGFVEKVIRYETGPVGHWNRRYLLLADDEYKSYPNEPDELRFRHIEQCEGMAVLSGDYLEPVKVYLTEFPFQGQKSKPDACRELLRQLNLGALLWVFFGHGASNALTHEEVFTVARVSDIHNGARIPFCFFGSCSVGRFDDTRNECIAEELVRIPGGAIATVAASTATPSGNNLIFARNLLTPLLVVPESSRTIGYGFFSAWPTDRSYHLFGDPATTLRIPRLADQSPVVKPDTLNPGVLFRVRSLLETEQGLADWRLFGPKRVRVYNSPIGSSINYLLFGDEMARGNFKVKGGRFYCEGIFPLAVLDTVFVGNGYYAPVPVSARFSAVVQSDSIAVSLVSSGLAFNSVTVSSPDQTGPRVSFFSTGRRLQDSAIVPPVFELEVVVEDSSGILIAPVAGAEPGLFINDPRDKVDIGDLLVFDDSSFSCARFRLRITLQGPIDSIFVTVFDNLLNRSQSKVVLRTVATTVLKVESVYVYPNPVEGQAFFTFNLNQFASVRIRIYTLTGRLVRDLGEVCAGFGYNQIFWDGRDRDGLPLPNGVYLFTLTAEGTTLGKRQRVFVRDKFLVAR
ncbi:MAG: C25 family cysteine peptidase [bacterium]